MLPFAFVSDEDVACISGRLLSVTLLSDEDVDCISSRLLSFTLLSYEDVACISGRLLSGGPPSDELAFLFDKLHKSSS